MLCAWSNSVFNFINYPPDLTLVRRSIWRKIECYSFIQRRKSSAVDYKLDWKYVSGIGLSSITSKRRDWSFSFSGEHFFFFFFFELKLFECCVMFRTLKQLDMTQKQQIIPNITAFSKLSLCDSSIWQKCYHKLFAMIDLNRNFSISDTRNYLPNLVPIAKRCAGDEVDYLP